jgi:class 3 adenylate cyclase/predicted Ser/Thr protein kinase
MFSEPMSKPEGGTGHKEITSLTEQLLHAFEELDLLHSVCEILSSSSDPDEANTHILCEAMSTLAADVGWVVYDDGRQAGEPMLRQNIDTRTATFLNESIVHATIKTGVPVWTDNLAQDLPASDPKVPKAFLCVPLKTRNEILGAICLGKHAEGAVFTAGDLKLVQILCAPAANAILQRRIERTSELKRYVSPQIAESVLSGGHIELTNKRAELTMFLAELKGFTEAAEEIEPEELVELLNQYLSAMTDIVFTHEGTLDKFVVGSIFGFFGDPIAQDDHAIRAIRMAGAMQKKFAELQAQWRTEGYKPFGLGIGINTGYVTVGHIGSSNRTDYTAIGKNAVVAAKLASMAEHGQILIGQRTLTKVRSTIKTQFVAACDIGTQPIKVYEVEYEKPPDRDAGHDEVGRPPAARGHRALISGSMVSHYRIIGKLGKGGMGEVYKAEDVRLSRTVALKILPSSGQDEEVKRRFVREAKSLSALNHPNIATIYEIDEYEGVNFISMEYIGGGTLKAVLDSETLSPSRVLDFAIPVADALKNAHDKNIIHRDIKPTNIMVSDNGYVKVMDFGLATLVAMPETDASTNMLTQAGMMYGTVGYMSPEQAMGVKLDQRSDIFSFGVVLYELITGQQPFVGANAMAVFHAVIFDQPVPIGRLRPDAPGELERVVNKTLQKKANERYQTLKDVLVDLKRLRNDISGPASDERL